MKLLALSDLHGDYSHIEAIRRKAGHFDAVLIAGDITDFGPDERALDLLAMFEEPVLAVPGNCDNPSLLKLLDGTTINLHNSCHTMEGLTFVGLGASNPTPFHTPFELSEREISEKVEMLLKTVTGRVVVLCHAPPRNTTDRLPAGNVGSEALASVLGRCDLVVCGHIHEARGSMRAKGTLVVNPGKASEGQAALININDEISVTFLDAE